MSTAPNSRIRSMDLPIIKKVFVMERGYVLDFSNFTFADFFLEEFGVDIYDDCWKIQGNSKANRLRCYLRTVDRHTALKALKALWEYREATNSVANYPKLEETVRIAFFRIFERLGGTPPEAAVPTSTQEEQYVDATVTSVLGNRLVEISDMEPQARGYAFETFLKDVFDAYGMAARASFRLKGEQIDGSFVLAEQIYLLEARWRNAKVDVETLRAFNGKVEEKASWSRGLIISQSGFTEDGLHAFGRAKRIICMDGLDLYEVLSGRHHLADVIARKVRRAAETGMAYVPVRNLNMPTPK